MKAETTYESIKQNLPELALEIEQELLKKLNKSKNKNLMSSNPSDWTWYFDIAQKIQAFSFNDLMNGTTTQKKEPETTEEKVFNLFNSGDLFVSIVAKEKNIMVNVNFPKFNDNNFYVPSEIVNSYSPTKETPILDNPTILLYVDDKNGKKLKESYVIGGLKDIKDNKELIVIQTPGDISYAYEINLPDNNLNAVMMVAVNETTKIKLNDFESSGNLFTINKKKYSTISKQDGLKLLQGQSQWIQDKQSVLNMLLGSLSSSPGFSMIGNAPKANKISKIPENLQIEVLHPEEDIELKKKFKVK